MNALRSLLVAGLLLGMGLPAHAASYVLMTDEALADQAPLIARVRILSRETGVSDLEPATDYQVEIQRSIKGFFAGSTLIVRVVGGRLPSGLALQVDGVPAFRPGEEALLFLAPRADGTYTIFQLMLGAFHRVESRGQELALRDLADAQVLDQTGSRVRQDQTRDFGRFANWLADRTDGDQRTKDYLVELPQGGHESVYDFFTLFEDPGTGRNMRWTNFDTGGSVTFFANESGQPGLTGGGFAEFQTALQAWNNDAGTPINLLYGGTTMASGGLTDCSDGGPADCSQGVNAIQFDDPNNNAMFGGSFSCPGGGVIALGGPWYDDSTTHNFKGVQYHRILLADVITNTNVACFLSQNAGAEEVFAHELGHTLGLRHSCGDTPSGACDTSDKDDALMRSQAHGDGRGARLGDDDQDGIALLYRSLQQEVCVQGPTTLCLNNDRFKVEVDWRTPNGNTGSGMAMELTSDTGYFWFFNADNVEMVIKVLNACGFSNRYWVFAGGLTNVEVDITVTDTSTGSSKSYMNPINTPFQPIQDTSAFATCP